ncbi:MAG TPA: HEPN domain-containing protein [Nitrospira sp.]|nr:HEPN domain-containing protein [Nitrospira sp.]
MSELEHAQALLGLSDQDYRALQGMTDTETFAEAIFGFHAQQSVEKTLKAWIASLGIRYPLTHDISTLLAILDEHGCDVEPFWTLVEYNAFAVQFRYELRAETEEPLDRLAVINDVRVLWEHVQALIRQTSTTY